MDENTKTHNESTPTQERVVPKKDQALGQMVVWQKTFAILRDTKRQTLAIALFGFILPQLAIQAFFDRGATATATQMRLAVDQMEHTTQGLTPLIEMFVGYFVPYLIANLGYLLLFMVTYLALTHVFVGSMRKESSSVVQAFGQGLKTALPSGVLVALLYLLLFLIGQRFFVFPLIIITSLGLMIPVILITRKAGAFESMGDAILIRYAKHTPFSAWNVLFAMLTTAALAYIGFLGSSYLGSTILFLDEALGLKRDAWVTSFGSFGGTVAYEISIVLSTLVAAVVVVLIPALTTSTYFEVVTPRPINKA